VKIHSRGFNLVEAVVSVTLAASFILALSAINTFYVRIALGHEQVIRASFLAEEGLEAARYMRDESWTNKVGVLTPGVEYYLYFSGTSWQATTTVTEPAGFERRIKFDAVSRDTNADISELGTLDPNTRLVTSSVAWSERGATTTKVISMYLTNLFSN
jgi:hypothetical protein